MMLQRNKFYYFRVCFCILSLAVVFIIKQFYYLPSCLYCTLSRAALILLATYYIVDIVGYVFNFPCKKFFMKRHALLFENILISVCFITGVLAMLAKYGIISRLLLSCDLSATYRWQCRLPIF